MQGGGNERHGFQPGPRPSRLGVMISCLPSLAFPSECEVEASIVNDSDRETQGECSFPSCLVGERSWEGSRLGLLGPKCVRCHRHPVWGGGLRGPELLQDEYMRPTLMTNGLEASVCANL